MGFISQRSKSELRSLLRGSFLILARTLCFCTVCGLALFVLLARHLYPDKLVAVVVLEFENITDRYISRRHGLAALLERNAVGKCDCQSFAVLGKLALLAALVLAALALGLCLCGNAVSQHRTFNSLWSLEAYFCKINVQITTKIKAFPVD